MGVGQVRGQGQADEPEILKTLLLASWALQQGA